MSRLAELDLPDRLAPAVPPWATQIGFALLCAAFGELGRFVINLLAPGSAVFALAFRAVMVATLFARWPSGLLAAALTIAYSYFHFFLRPRVCAHR